MTHRLDLPAAGSPQSWAWSASLALAALGGTLATACMMPFVALATILAMTVRPVQAAMAISGIWAGNQLIGFGLLGYPLTEYAFAWGAALLAASLTAMLVAHLGRAMAGRTFALAARFIAAFVTFEGLLFAFAHLAGGLETFTPTIVARIGLNDAIWFVLLVGLNFLLTRTAPQWFGSVSVLRASA